MMRVHVNNQSGGKRGRPGDDVAVRVQRRGTRTGADFYRAPRETVAASAVGDLAQYSLLIPSLRRPGHELAWRYCGVLDVDPHFARVRSGAAPLFAGDAAQTWACSDAVKRAVGERLVRTEGGSLQRLADACPAF